MYPPDATAPQALAASGAEPPAVVSLLAGHLDDTGYPATLLDLAARGWFRLAGWQRRQAALAGDGPRAALPGAEPGAGPGLAADDVATMLDVTDGDQTLAYAAALGAAPGAVAAFTRSHTLVWSSYGGRWRQLVVGDPAERSWSAGAALPLFAGLGVSFFSALVLIGGLVVHGIDGAVLVAGGVAGVVAGVVLLRQAKLADQQLPSTGEFHGVVLERWTWVHKGEESDTTCYAVALDDGQQDHAWAFTVDHGVYARLVPGTLVHATVNPRRNRLVAADVTGTPQLPPQVAAAQAAKQPLRARLVKADEAARVLGVPEKEVQRYLLGVSCIWKRAKGRGSITITTGRRAMLARHAERTGRPLPHRDGVERWLVGHRSVVLRRGTMVVKIILSGHLGLDRGEALAWLTDLVTERLAAAPGDETLSEDEWTPTPER